MQRGLSADMGPIEVADLDVRMWCFTFNMGAHPPEPSAAARARTPVYTASQPCHAVSAGC